MTQNNKAGATSVSLLSEGKSLRLMDLRRKAMGVAKSDEVQKVDALARINNLGKDLNKELLYARQIIDQNLSDILKNYPASKQKRFFKLRFGLSVEQLKNLSIYEICSVLGIKQKKLSNMPWLAELDYFGGGKPNKR